MTLREAVSIALIFAALVAAMVGAVRATLWFLGIGVLLAVLANMVNAVRRS